MKYRLIFSTIAVLGLMFADALVSKARADDKNSCTKQKLSLKELQKCLKAQDKNKGDLEKCLGVSTVNLKAAIPICIKALQKPLDKNTKIRVHITLGNKYVAFAHHRHGSKPTRRAAIYAKARSEFNKAIALDPENHKAYFGRRNTYYKMPDADQKELSDLNMAIRLDPENRYYLKSRAEYYFGKNDYDQAIAEYSHLISKGHPYHHERARVYKWKKDWDKAIADLSVIIKNPPEWDRNPERYYFDRANLYYKAGDYKNVITDMNTLFDVVNPKKYKDANWYRLRAKAYTELGNYDRAIADLDFLIKRGSGTSETFLLRGNAYSGKGKYEKAVGEYSEAIRIRNTKRRSRKYVEAYEGRARAYEKLGQQEKARADFAIVRELGMSAARKEEEKPTIKVKPGTKLPPPPPYVSGKSKPGAKDIPMPPPFAPPGSKPVVKVIDSDCWTKKDAEIKITACTRIIETNQINGKPISNDEKVAIFTQRGQAYLNKQKIRESIADYDHAVKLNPNEFVVYNNRGIAYYRLKKYEKAEADYRKALQLKPDDKIAKKNLVVVQRMLAKKKSTATTKVAGSPAALIKSGWKVFYHDRSHLRYKKALSQFEQAVKLDPQNAEAYVGRGASYGAQKLYKKSLADLNQAIKLDPDLALARYWLGRYYHANGKFNNAVTALNKAAELDPKDYFIHFQLGQVYFDLKKYDKALAAFSNAFEVDPGQSDSVVWRGHSYAALNQKRKAVVEFKAASKMRPNDHRLKGWISSLEKELKR